jgi:hypothetical protein
MLVVLTSLNKRLLVFNHGFVIGYICGECCSTAAGAREYGFCPLRRREDGEQLATRA